MKDYHLTNYYHLGKAHIVAEALSRKSDESLVTLITRQARLLRTINKFYFLIHKFEYGQRTRLRPAHSHP